MSRLLAMSVNKPMLKEALALVSAPGDHTQCVTNKLEDLLRYVRSIEEDIEADKAADIAGTRPQDRRKQFVKLASKLEDIAEELAVLRGPALRYKEDPEFPRTRPVGLTEFRTAVSNWLTQPLSSGYIGTFGIEPFEWDRNNVSLGPINTRNRASAIEEFAEEISTDLIHRLASALRDAERELKTNTPKGGHRHGKIQDTLLLNVVAIWQQIHGNKEEASYNRGPTIFFTFCVQICKAVGGGNLCTEAHLRKAVRNYNNQNLPTT